MLAYIIAATLIVSLVSLVGVVLLGVQEGILNKVVEYLVSFAVGGLLGGAFFHLLPEAVASGNPLIFAYVLSGLLVFFLIENLLHWRHCHKGQCDAHTFTYLSLLGDGMHNFVDGMIIAASFVTDVRLGVAATVAVVIHEIPQEIGDFGILVYGGFSKKKALLCNLITALTAVLGAIAAYMAFDKTLWLKDYLIPFSAGGFIYIALVDMMPELHKRVQGRKIAVQLITMLIGLGLMGWLKES